MFVVELKQTEVTAALNRAVAAMEDMTPLMQSIGKILVDSAK